MDGISFSDPQHGLGIVTDPINGKSALLATSNGGQTWKKGADIPCNTRFLDQKVGWGLCSSDWIDNEQGPMVFYRTVDGGLSWQAVALPFSVRIASWQFLDAQTGEFESIGGDVYGTQDGGITWKQIQIEKEKFPLRNDQGGWLILHGTSIYHTRPGETAWTLVGKGEWIPYLDEVSDQVAFLLVYDENGNPVLQKTSNGGKNWAKIALNEFAVNSYSIFPIEFIDDQNGWLSSRLGLFRTTDGGLSWSQIQPNVGH